MKTKKRNLFLILAACCLGLGAIVLSNLNPLNAIYADNVSYGMTFNSSKNKFHNYSGAIPHSGEATVKTNLDNNINFEYKDLMGIGSTWHVAKTGGYFTNLDPINGLEKINISFKTNNINYKIYWSYTTTFDEINVYSGTSSTSSPLKFHFFGSFPTYFKFENSGSSNLNIGEINFEFTCLNGAPTINVASNDETLGTVSGGGTYVYGEKVTLIANPNIGVEFVGWYENDTLVSKDNPYTFNAEFNRNINGKFAIKTYQVKVEYNSSMGSISGEGSYSYGDNVTLKATPNEGYSFFGWYENEILISQENPLSFSMENFDLCYEARFVKNYKITIINDYEEMGSVETTGEFGAGLEASVKAIPYDGYKFNYWCDEDLNIVSYSTEYSFAMPGNDVVLYSIFEGLPFGISVINYNNNYVSIIGEGEYLCGEEVEIFADFQEGELIGWYLNNQLVSTNNPFKFKMTPYNIQLEVRWHNLTISNDNVIDCPEDVKHAYFPDSVTSIGDEAFYKCPSLTSVTIGKNVTSIGEDAFMYCSSLTSIIITDSVTSIGEDAFYDCSSLTNVYYTGTIEDWCKISFSFSGRSNPMCYAEHFYMLNESNEWYDVTEIVIPNTITEIGDYQFCGFDNVTSITIPDSVTSIGVGAFSGCSSLTNVYNKGTLEDWCNISFSNSYSNPMCYAEHFYMLNESNEWYEVTEIVIPNTITEIGRCQFYGFENVTSITIPNSVTSIGYSAFEYCSSLTSVTIGDSVNSIGGRAFSYCSSIASIVIPDSVTSIGQYAFYKCSSLTSITLPFIGGGTTENAFFEYIFGASKYNDLYDYEVYVPASLKEIIISDTCTSISRGAFYECSSLTSITIPNSVTSIGQYAFYKCSSLTNVYYKGTLEDWCNISFSDSYSNPMYYAEHFYMLNESNEWYEVTEIVIPNTITEIGCYQFYGFENVTSITIPNSVTSIGQYAFYKCSSLKNIDFNATIEQWNSINKGSSWNSSYLKTITCTDGVIYL